MTLNYKKKIQNYDFLYEIGRVDLKKLRFLLHPHDLRNKNVLFSSYFFFSDNLRTDIFG